MKKKFLMLLVIGLVLGLCACGSEVKNESSNSNVSQNNEVDNSDNVKEEQEEKIIEITIDNWQEYYEIKEIATIVRDEFDDIESIGVNKYLSLKEEYVSRIVWGEIVFEWDTRERIDEDFFKDYEKCCYEYNLETEELKKVVLEQYSHEESILYFPMVVENEDGECINIPLGSGYGGGFWNGSEFQISEENIVTFEQNQYQTPTILRFKGTIALIEE